MSILHDNRLKTLADMVNKLRVMDLYEKGRERLIWKIHAEQGRLLRTGITEAQIGNLIHDRHAKFYVPSGNHKRNIEQQPEQETPSCSTRNPIQEKSV